jgi:hypothetical protein
MMLQECMKRAPAISVSPAIIGILAPKIAFVLDAFG